MKKEIRVRIEQDDFMSNPREEWDNFGKMVCWHGRYSLGDEHNFSAEEFKEYILSRKDVIALPLYLYDHSGITMSTSQSHPFDCPWDAGQVGWIYCTYEDIRKEYSKKRISRELKERVVNLLVSEVNCYDHFLTGDVWGFIIEEKEVCSECGDEDWEHIDSCWGFYGDIKESGILEHIPNEYHKLIEYPC
jgi:hypothetical protein